MPLALLTLLTVIVVATGYFFSQTWLPILAANSGGAIDHQLTLNFILLGVVFCATQLALGLFVWKYREQQNHKGIAEQAQPDARVELAWLTLAAVLFLGLNIAGALFWGQSQLQLADKEKNPYRVEVDAVQFRWYFRYPGPDGKFGQTQPEFVDAAEGNPLGIDRRDPSAADDRVSTTLVLPEGRETELVLRAQDVIHSFFVPALRVKQDAVPGEAIILYVHPTRVGVYDIACAQLCGMGHYQMNAKLKVVHESEFETWLAHSAPAAAKR